jgi:hypothetical protein
MNRNAILSAAAAAIGLAFSASAPAQAISKAAYDAARRDIAGDYRTARIGCEPMEGDVRDSCVADVRGRHEIALAELEVAYRPGAKTLDDLRLAKSRTDHQVAIGKCDEKAGKARDTCIAEAKRRYPGS